MSNFNKKEIKSFKLQKLKIFSFDNEERTDGKNEFEVMFNPESVRRSFVNKFTNDASNPQNKSSTKFMYSGSSTVSMKLVFDGTHVDQYGAEIAFRRLRGTQKNVTARIDDFLTNIAKIKGKIHEPRHLVLSWGETLKFNCRLTSLDINYTLFNRSGDPLRAELNVSFIGDNATKEQLAELDLQSPDLTHYRMVKAGDQLPLMCQEIYGSPFYYPLVASANRLTDFRNLIPGQEIYFPPIEK
ncbi:glycoside hydrolase family 66 protein [Aquimarina gracilis]|uniref:Glycoside hydrolase family 66 protein n=1 Tax=Aquimarina gracilis TaxID=874422 RepID=A0ABU5ZPL4_9FLAO|nr:glycoside hydrolase family 66 protein [Aquimarina gracilis]MEB3344054.1 glycoside hydrolase family 66 protein [Aquimarina gracilis]